MARLIDYVVDDPPEDSEDKIKFIYPYKASEVRFSTHQPVWSILPRRLSAVHTIQAMIPFAMTKWCQVLCTCKESANEWLHLSHAEASTTLYLDQVLASDLNAVYDCLFANEDLVDKLFSFLDRDEPLNALLAGYFAKIVSTLLARRPDETFAVMESKSIVPQMLKHLNTYSVLELLLKVVSEVEEASMRGHEFDWLYQINMVQPSPFHHFA